MSVLSGLVLAKLTAPALVVAVSPISIGVSLVLLAHNDRPYSSSVAYLLGRLVSLTALAAAFMQFPRLFDGLLEPAPAWADGVVVGAGVVLMSLGTWLWWRRAHPTGGLRWEGSVGRITPSAAAAIGMLPMLANPKVLAASAAVGTQIASVRMTAAGSVLAVAYYAALASSTVAAPVLAYLVVGPRIDPQLERIRQWIQRRHRALAATAVVLAGFAVVLYGLS
ncbi:GAP family protein [Mycobacterium sp. 4858]|uniref:GAP family protein n=1 Tax=Mycobacterium sp. 4858 TaxID=2057185 RepID=UPI001304E427|nr:GAP family protein [Mycobacterium sp. 4858]